MLPSPLRLQQIAFQSKGLLVHVSDPRISSQLTLSASQRSQIEAILRTKSAMEAEIQKARQEFLTRAQEKHGAKSPPRRLSRQQEQYALWGYDDQLYSIESDAVRSVDGLLTEDQKLTYSTMTGPRFDFSR